MKYFISMWLILCLLACSRESRFKFGEPVEIKSGIYEDCTGAMDSFDKNLLECLGHGSRYGISDLMCRFGSKKDIVYFCGDELK